MPFCKGRRVVLPAQMLILWALLAVFVMPAAAEINATEMQLQPSVQRIITHNLTSWLHATLTKNKVTQLLVLPHAKGIPMKIDWQALNSTVASISHVRSARELLQQLHVQQHVRHSIKSLVTGNTATVALLVQGADGSVNMQQLNLAATISRHFRRVHLLNMQYNNYPDKGDTILLFNKAGMPVEIALASTAVFRDTFTRIYDSKVWGSEGGGSGPGSSLERTQKLRAYLLDVIARYNISSMLDSSCGSMLWMPLVLKEAEARNPGFNFMGTDVVCTLTAQHNKTHANHSSWGFDCVDYANQPLPSGYELVFSRDSLQHVPLHAVWQFLNNVKATGAKYLLVGSYPHSPDPNREIQPGDCYNVDLLKPPFNASKPLEEFEEGDHEGKHMLLFDLTSMTWQDTLEGLL